MEELRPGHQVVGGEGLVARALEEAQADCLVHRGGEPVVISKVREDFPVGKHRGGGHIADQASPGGHGLVGEAQHIDGNGVGDAA